MSEETTLQRPSFWLVSIVIAVVFAIDVAKYAMLLAGPVGNNPFDPAIRETAFLVVWLWPWGAALPFAIRHWQPGQPGTPAGRIRWAHTIAWGLCLLHVAIAFHVGHAWSHGAAFDHTERVSGFGPGIFVNYLFVMVWTGDVLWAWINLDSYLGRAGWVNWLVLGFMGFVVFNAAVVFGSGMQRWASLLFLVIPALLVWSCWRWSRDNRTRPS
jgi:hypothetical protein